METPAYLPPQGSPHRAWLDLAFELVDAADAISMRHFRRDLHVETKPDRSFVTQADTAIERLVKERLAASLPTHGVVGEEYGETPSAEGFRWFVDPIDGTHNYIRGIPVFATLLALDGPHGLEVGMVSAPALGSRWYAWRRGGAWALDQDGARAVDHGTRGARRLRVSGVERVEDAQLLSSSLIALSGSAAVPGFAATFRRAWRERGFGDFWGYTLVAEGAAEAMVEVGISSWDIAPLRLLVEEAGGRLTDLDGVPTIHGAGAIASNGLLHDELVRSLHAHPEGGLPEAEPARRSAAAEGSI